ncbi:hypothetical protein CPE01_28070 [Cellulomonas persica]|uniref:Uncharacterized protein n=1 Tax=Cellulomonas persica TaxID=76861 RepID=A0A510UWK7_9CELL|nr:hypothetical protein CPE01_28070 [Cellulomonas persica]
MDPFAPPVAAPTAGPLTGAETTLSAETLGAIARTVEERVVARLDAWRRDELDEHVLRLVERRLEEETERRSWRRGSEVF